MVYVHTEGKFKKTKLDKTVSVLPDVCPVPDCIPGASSEKGSPASPGTYPFPVFFSVQGQVLQEEEDLPPCTVLVLLVLQEQKKTLGARYQLRRRAPYWFPNRLPLLDLRLASLGHSAMRGGGRGRRGDKTPETTAVWALKTPGWAVWPVHRRTRLSLLLEGFFQSLAKCCF